MEDKNSKGSIRGSPSLKSTLSGRSSSKNSPSFRRLSSVRTPTPRRESKINAVRIQWMRSNRVVLWLLLITIWAYIGFYVQSRWAHSDHSKAEFVGYNSKPNSIGNKVDANVNSSVEESALGKSNTSNSQIFGVGLLRKRKSNKRSLAERRPRKVASQPKVVVAENKTSEIETDEVLVPRRNTSYGLIVGPFGQTEDRVLEWNVDKRRGTCDRKGEFARIVWSRRFVLIFHELSMTGAPLSMMELATELLSCGATVSAVVLSRKGGLMGELNRRRIKVLNDRADASFKTATRADLVIAGSAVCSSWIEQYLTKFPASSSQVVWWIMENRREYFDRSKQILNRVKMLTFLSEAQSKQWLAWCEEEHIQMYMEPMIVPLSVSDELAFVAGIPCSLNSPAFTAEKMLEKRDDLRTAVRKEMGLDDNDMLVMSLSSINPGKGQRFLLESALLVAERNISLKDVHIDVKELIEVNPQNTNDKDDELILGVQNANQSQTSQKSSSSKKPSKKRKRKRSRSTRILPLANDTLTEDEIMESGISRNLLSEIQDNAEQSLKLLIGSVGSKSNKVLYIKSILRFLSQHSSLSKLVRWTPSTTRVASLYAAADVYAINAQGPGETFGRVTIEAMAFGLPVVGTDAGGTQEIIEHGVTGLLHPVGREGIHALAQNIQFLLSNPSSRKKMGANGRIKVKSMYLKQHTYESFARVLVKCMKVK